MIRVALNHKTIYRYDRAVELGAQVVRLRPAPHCRTPICSYSLSVKPADHFLNWQQDPHSNFLGRLLFEKPTRSFEVEVNLIAEMTVINPFDFFLDPVAEKYPFRYEPALEKDLKPFLDPIPSSPRFAEFVASIDRAHRIKTIDFLVTLNQRLQNHVNYVIRMEPGVQSPEETLQLGTGSCRDSAWLMVQVLRHLGLASRFVSGYLIQLKPDLKSLDGPSGAETDFTDLHAWCEVFLPGAGWIGLDPTSGLFAGEGHLPLACTPEPGTAAPISGTTSQCEVEFHHEMSVTRIHEDPRVTKPFTRTQWEHIDSVGHAVDELLNAGDVRLTMGGEPTFVSIDDMDGDEWKTAAVGPTKRTLAGNLIDRLRKRFAPHGLIHYGQGKWYPGEQLPRWSLTCMWRTDGQPIWHNTDLLADPEQNHDFTIEDAKLFSKTFSMRLGVNPGHVTLAYEDALYYIWKEQRLPANTEVQDADLEDPEERARLARVFGRGLGTPSGCLLPLMHQWWNARPRWTSGLWPVRADQMFLIPGDSPMGLRLPLDSLPAAAPGDYTPTPVVPFESVEPLPNFEYRRRPPAFERVDPRSNMTIQRQVLTASPLGGSRDGSAADSEIGKSSIPDEQSIDAAEFESGIIRTAMCIEPRDGRLCVFMPPVERLEHYLELLSVVEQTAAELGMPVIIEGYLPPADYRLQQIKATPDPGVIEVNIHPASNWDELVAITTGVYEDARQSRLGTEKFDTDGTHTGTGGGNHIVMGAATPSDSPFLRRPDLLRSLIGYWHNHPSLSYLFSGRFIGPTSQAPRVDEGRRDATYEMQIAFEQIPDQGGCPPSLVDRVFRHLLVDLTGNTHRAEICIDKLFSPDSVTGRLGLVEFRGFEMPPHAEMSLTQQLLMRALVARFWERPYRKKLIDWNTSIHDRWMLPHYVHQDFEDVIEKTAAFGIPLQTEWFATHFEFRFPSIGVIEQRGIRIELRTAIEPWYVLGEEPAGGVTARYVDSSVERMQIKVNGMNCDRHVITCNGRRIPLQSTGTQGEYVAGVRYRAWQPTSCLHPTIPVDEPLLFDILDTWHERSIGGGKYHIGHPGGLNPSTFPVNAFEAESRRGVRFTKTGFTGGPFSVPKTEPNELFPLTLDLRRNRNKR